MSMPLLGRRRAEKTTDDGVDFAGYVRGLAEYGSAEVAGPLANPRAESLRTAAREHFAREGPSEPLERAASAYESSVMHAIAMGWSLRFGEASLGPAAPPPPELLERITGAPEPEAEAAVAARALARPSRGDESTEIDAQTLGPGEAQRTPAGARAKRPPKPEFLALFAPGEEVWRELEGWIRLEGTATARRRMQDWLKAAGVGSDFGVDHALARIDYESPFRFAYVFAACEACLS